MITTVLVAGAGGPAEAVAAPALRLATDLTGQPPDRVLTLPADLAAASGALSRSDVVVVASALADGAMDVDLRRLLDLLRPGARLSGVVAFALTVGDWPVDAGAVHFQLKPALQAAGASCLAPGLHLTRSPFGPDRALAAYTAFWRPVVGALVGLGTGHDGRQVA